MFFMDENFKFGTPLRIFQDWMCKGFFNPKISKIRAANKKVLLKEYKYVLFSIFNFIDWSNFRKH